MRAVLLAAGLALAAPQSRWSEDPGPESGLLWIDTDQSPVAGADNVLFLHAAYGRLVDHLLPVRVFAQERGWQRAGNAFWRFGRLFLVDHPGATFLPVFQHELYGHGWRAREAGYLDIAYELSAPFPYGYGEGSTSWKYAPSRLPGPDGALAMSMAGIEATDILARRLRARLAATGTLDYHTAQLYSSSALGLWSYAYATGDDDTTASNDVIAWLTVLNGKSGTGRAEWTFTREDLEGSASLAAALDPFIWYSAAAVLAHIWSGEARWKLPMIPVGGGLRWLPLAGYRLSPYGGQWLMENLVAAKGRVFALRGAFGSGPAGRSLAGDLEAVRLASWRGADLDAALRIWRQPRLWVSAYDTGPTSPVQRPGGAFDVTALSPPLSAGFPLRLALGYGYKSAGWSPGLPLEAGSTVRAGVGLQR